MFALASGTSEIACSPKIRTIVAKDIQESIAPSRAQTKTGSPLPNTEITADEQIQNPAPQKETKASSNHKDEPMTSVRQSSNRILHPRREAYVAPSSSIVGQ